MSWWSKIVSSLINTGQITDNFHIDEFACKDGTPYPKEWVDSRLRPLCAALEVIRECLNGKSITINSGYRTPDYNKSVGGASKSQHLYGKACDIRVKGLSARKVALAVRQLINDGKIPSGGVGEYSSFVHYDQRGTNARWKGS